MIAPLAAAFTFALFTASREPVFAEDGMVVSASQYASQAGVDILKRGGNAVDAAVATGFALAVTFPQAGNIGGGGFMVARFVDGRTFALDFRETAPAGATRDMFLDESGNVVEGRSLETLLATGVPGSVDGLLRAWEDYGSDEISRRRLLDPAVRLAKRGFVLDRETAREFNRRLTFFEQDPTAAEIFVRSDGREWRARDVVRQPDLADTLRRIRSEGRDGFYGGKTAELVAEFMAQGGGLITRDDLASYRSEYREPLRGTFRGHTVITMPPPSSGALVIQLLNMLEAYDLAELGWGSSAYAHLLTEAQRRAYADRAEYFGDPDFASVPVARLISTDYARERIASLSMEKATPSAAVSAGAMPAAESEQTTHYSVVDRAGNVVAVTTTLNASYGSGIVAPGAGFFLNNEMDDFSSKPGTPNLYGLVGSEANAIEPGKRMLSSMTPTIVLKDEEPYLVVGSPGGATIITTTLQVILNVVVHGMDIQEAVSAPRHHSQWLPDEIVYEERAFPRDVLDNLRKKGHTLRMRDDIGHANCLMVTPEGYFGAPDPRGNNVALGN